jgi:hypothetical protein
LLQGARRARTLIFFGFIGFLRVFNAFFFFFFFFWVCVLHFSLSDLGLVGSEVDPMRYGWVKRMDTDLAGL